ncbi:hypothetical protein LCGC14_0232560 [marine sediment metagenome]|uniref:NusG-like N-terminal domain-containing protein n=1 Tax=marine sediment metagenome TaxID=412755 RepID=A0A0F9UAB6_9ZZZZ
MTPSEDTDDWYVVKLWEPLHFIRLEVQLDIVREGRLEEYEKEFGGCTIIKIFDNHKAAADFLRLYNAF